jgi:hypothetical protein
VLPCSRIRDTSSGTSIIVLRMGNKLVSQITRWKPLE